jgi:hypothetical protein
MVLLICSSLLYSPGYLRVTLLQPLQNRILFGCLVEWRLGLVVALHEHLDSGDQSFVAGDAE